MPPAWSTTFMLPGIEALQSAGTGPIDITPSVAGPATGGPHLTDRTAHRSDPTDRPRIRPPQGEPT